MYHRRRLLRDDLDGCSLTREGVLGQSDPPRGAFAERPTELPWTYVRLSLALVRDGGGIRNLGVAFPQLKVVFGDFNYALVAQ